MFGKGKIQVTIPGTDFAPGDSISGEVSLTLKKPVKADGMSISLIGEQKVTRSGSVGRGGQRSTTTQTVRIYDFKQKLDTAREYIEGRDYKFKIKIPGDILGVKAQLPELDDTLAKGLKIAQATAALMGAISVQQTKWFLLAKLDIPGGLDISEKTDITIE